MKYIKMPHEYREPIDLKCPVCGKDFKGLSIAVYCSNACQCKAARARRKAKKLCPV